MRKISLKERVARRNRKLAILVLIIVVLSVVCLIMMNKEMLQIDDMLSMVLSALVSTVLAIYMTKEDILENDYAKKKDDFGVLTFENGFQEIFKNEDAKAYLKSDDWEDFFQHARWEKKIFFVGISFYDFFDYPERREQLYRLCSEKECDVYIILANPYDREITRINQLEEKTDENELQQRIIKTYKLFDSDSKKTIEQKITDRIHIYFSVTVPTALVIKSGTYMIITPYMLDSPNRTPTIIVEDSKAHSFYEKYNSYVKKLLKYCNTYKILRKSIVTDEFFTQSYTNLSEEFLQDIKKCNYMAIIGLSQKRILGTLKSEYSALLKRGGKIDIILTDPDGESTKMCTRRSSGNRDDISGDSQVHKETINRLLDLKETIKTDNLNIYISDFMYPYTMYAFDCKDGVTDDTKMYIWQTILFEGSDKRPGFVCEGKEDKERMKSYYRQFIELRDGCNLTKQVTKKYINE